MDMEREILVVDDDADIRNLIDRILRHGGFKVVHAENGKDGLNKCRIINPRIIITDIIMPDMEGIEFIKELRKNGISVPIIALSGNEVGMNFLKTAHMFGAQASLQKPFSITELLGTVIKVLEKTPT